MFYTRFRFRHTAADAAESVIYAMRNPVSSGKLLEISRLTLTTGFDGASATSESGHGWRRFSGASPTGGSSPARIKHSTRVKSIGTSGASVVTDASIKEGAVLTLAAAFEGYFDEQVIPMAVGSVIKSITEYWPRFQLQPGEGIALSNTLVAVIGLTASGFVEWEEVDA